MSRGRQPANAGERLRCRRAHSPAATSAAASSAPKNSAQAGPDQAGLDGILDQEDAAERQRDAADPDHPAGAEAFLEADRRCSGAAAPVGRAASGGGAAGSAAGNPAATRGWRLGWRQRARVRRRRWCGAVAARALLPGNAAAPGVEPARRASSAAKALVDVDRLDQRHDGDDRKRTAPPGPAREEFHRCAPASRILCQRQAPVDARSAQPTGCAVMGRGSAAKVHGDGFRLVRRAASPGAGRSCTTSRRKRNSAAGPPAGRGRGLAGRLDQRGGSRPAGGSSACADAGRRSPRRCAAIRSA